MELHVHSNGLHGRQGCGRIGRLGWLQSMCALTPAGRVTRGPWLLGCTVLGTRPSLLSCLAGSALTGRMDSSRSPVPMDHRRIKRPDPPAGLDLGT